VFSRNDRWLAYRIEPSPEDAAELRREKQPVRNDLGLLRLQAPDASGRAASTGADPDTSRLEGIQRFGFSWDGDFLAALRYAVEDVEEDLGQDLLVQDLSGATQIHFGNVKEFAWSDEGHLLAMLIAASGGVGNGVQLYNPRTGTLRVLDSEPTDYTGLVWREDAWDLAVLRAAPDTANADTAYAALAWTGMDEASYGAFVLETPGRADVPVGQAVVPYRAPSWSDDGEILFLGLQELEPKPEEDPEVTARDSSSVEVWHSGDVDVIPRQKLMDRQFREENRLAAWHLDQDRVVPLGDDLTEEVRPLGSSRWGLGLDPTPYDEEAQFFPQRWDLYRIDLRTGEKVGIQDGVAYFYPGPAGRKLLFTEEEAFWIHDVESGERSRVDSRISTSLVNEVDDHPMRERRPWGVAGWTPGERAVLLYDRYDVWEVDADGGRADRLTRGAEDSVRHRYLRLDEETDDIDLRDPQYFSIFGEWTKQSGFARWGGRGHATERILLEDRSVSGLRKADGADVFVFRKEAFDDSPDLFVAGPGLRNPRQLTETNPFQRDYAWGRAELVEFENPVSDARLQGVLHYPAGYEPGVRYPMIVYIYERLSNGIHRYRAPSERSAYNPTVFTSQGYFVFMPDLTFRRRDPGFSALACVESAVRTVLAREDLDPDRVGVMGHSWGGYETTFFATHSDLFKAAVAGAPLTNLVSMYGMVFWNTGLPETSHYQWSQERMEVTLWDDPEAYLRNSTVMDFDKLDTPLLMAFGDEDGSVDWHQGLEAYNFARRLEKEFVLLVYRGENHSNRQKANQVDYFHRQLEWFNHYLKGEPAPDWISEGVSWIDQEKRRAGG
jgi:dipeptidyl aminopeptidase/acylaminoacyl peptidase